MWRALRRYYTFRPLTLSLRDKLEPLHIRHKEASVELLKITSEEKQNPYLINQLQIEVGKLAHSSDIYHRMKTLMQSLTDLEELTKTSKDEMLDLAKEELAQAELDLKDVEEESLDIFLPSTEDDQRNVILEVRPGVGGSESSLFAEDLLHMFTDFAQLKGWRVRQLSLSKDMQLGKGCKEGVVQIEGDRVYKRLRHEAGVHKVIRVPVTERSGRLHSSTASVVVMPEAPPNEFQLSEKDLRIEFMRAKGAGGQHVNKTDSACRITHIPTGLNAQNQDSRSQHMNKDAAMQVLAARVYNFYNEQKKERENSDRKSMIGEGGRSEKIRTYNFPQDRISDHRTGLTLYGMEEMLLGKMLDKFVDAMEELERKNLIESLINSS